MCDPMTIAGIALTAGSTFANAIAARRVQKARDDALAAERIRQNALDQEAQALNAASQDRYQDFGTQQEERSSSLADFFNEVPADVTPSRMPESKSRITVTEEAAQKGKAKDFSNQQGEALAGLRSFGDLLGGIGRDQARDAGLIGQIGGFMRGSNNVLPLELDQANQAGNGMKMFGDLLGLGGSLTLNAGLGGSSFSNPFSRTRLPSTAPIPTPRSSVVSLYG